MEILFCTLDAQEGAGIFDLPCRTGTWAILKLGEERSQELSQSETNNNPKFIFYYCIEQLSISKHLL